MVAAHFFNFLLTKLLDSLTGLQCAPWDIAQNLPVENLVHNCDRAELWSQHLCLSLSCSPVLLPTQLVLWTRCKRKTFPCLLHKPNMPSPSDSSSVASASGSRGWSDSRRGISGRGPGGARLLLYLGLCHLGLGAMVLAFSFTSMAFTTTPRVRQSCPFWAGFFVSVTPTENKQQYVTADILKEVYHGAHAFCFQVVASGIVGIISWRRPLTLVVCVAHCIKSFWEFQTFHPFWHKSGSLKCVFLHNW